MNNHNDEAEETRQLRDDLQKAALRLIKHSGANYFRIRIEGSMPALYITVGEGRSSYSADSVIIHGQQGAPPQLAPDLGAPQSHVAAREGVLRAPLISYFSKLKKVLAV